MRPGASRMSLYLPRFTPDRGVTAGTTTFVHVNTGAIVFLIALAVVLHGLLS